MASLDDESWPSSVLFESGDKAIVLLDIPRSLEESQVPHDLLSPPDHGLADTIEVGAVGSPMAPLPRIYSADPHTQPFHTPEPGATGKGPGYSYSSHSPATQVADLMTGAAVEAALEMLKTCYQGPLHIPRILSPEQSTAGADPSPLPRPVIPPNTHHLHGSIQDMRQTFLETAPKFDLMILDPPWPNRSARRRTDKYATVASLPDMRRLLDDIPVPSHLAENGLVAFWITNKSTIMEFLTSTTGLLASWGLELVAEWTWIKVTTSGEPLYDIDSQWRKPWEKLVIAKRISATTPSKLKPKILVAVPDVHSRKPNLRGIFQDVLGEDYVGLEIFARNLTAGWWSWGDEVLHFQDRQHWGRVVEQSTSASE